MMVSQEDAWHFCYVLPAKPGEPIQIVVPTSLQMGWCESPPFFCTATEMACDLVQHMLQDATNPLPMHPLEHLCLPPPETLPHIQPHMIPQLIRLLKVYVNDFIGLIQAPSAPELQHYTRAILHAINKISPQQWSQKSH